MFLFPLQLLPCWNFTVGNVAMAMAIKDHYQIPLVNPTLDCLFTSPPYFRLPGGACKSGDDLELHGADGENFGHQAVELVEAAPTWRYKLGFRVSGNRLSKGVTYKKAGFYEDYHKGCFTAYIR